LDFELTLISSVYDRVLFSSDVTAWALLVTTQHHEKHTFVLSLHDKQNTFTLQSYFGCYIINILFCPVYVSKVLYKICGYVYECVRKYYTKKFNSLV
jgi:hypothetical protein